MNAQFRVVGGGAPPLVSSSEPPHDGGMEARMTKLETRLDTILPTLATKADIEAVRGDVHKVSSEMKGWFIATAILVIVSMFTIANIMFTQVRGLAPTPSQSSAPVIIQVPAQSAALGTAPTKTPSAPVQP